MNTKRAWYSQLNTALAIRLTLGAAILATSVTVAHADSGVAGVKSIGLVLVTWKPANYEEGGNECPEGFHNTNQDNWRIQYPTEEQQAAYTKTYIHLAPTSAGGPIPLLFTQNRGPQGANVAYNPTSVQDPPVPEVQSKVSYGLNLDGTEDGRATPNSCAHETFESPTGEKGIDNQLFRLNGCWRGWRNDGFNTVYHSGQFISSSLNRVLINVTGVDDELNDDDVEVAIYKGIDGISLDTMGNPLPWHTQRIDTRFPRYMAQTRGRIVNGVLKTDPVDVRFGMYQMNSEGERFIHGVRLDLKLSGTGAEGLLAGYEDLEQWWRGIRNSYMDVASNISYWSPPATYVALHRLADGYPDPETGQCSAISSAYAISAVRVYVTQPKPDDPLVIDPIVTQGIVQNSN